MQILDYLNTLLNFYTKLSGLPLARLTVFEPDNLCEVHFKNIYFSVKNNIGFHIGKTCYITGKLATHNAAILEKYISPEYDTYLTTIRLDKKYCELYIYDEHGWIIQSDRIKFASVNLF